MSDLLKNIIRFAIFILVQVFVLDKVPPLHRFISPYLYFLFLLWLPFRMPRVGLTLLGFIFGMTLDMFSKTPGLHAAACTLVAYIRPFLISLMMPKEKTEISYAEPSLTSMGWMPYSIYVLILSLLHNGYLVFLEWMQFGNFWYFLGKVLATTGISLLLIAVTELLFTRKSRYRTNLA
ncbi:MAG: rod shape-determining protein MreD [Chitinophagaceae bacterium]|jgi:rod shape-determining protein MreD|nr:rod shape-determining protein MreD [Chitinophagaceae bacterium]